MSNSQHFVITSKTTISQLMAMGFAIDLHLTPKRMELNGERDFYPRFCWTASYGATKHTNEQNNETFEGYAEPEECIEGMMTTLQKIYNPDSVGMMAEAPPCQNFAGSSLKVHNSNVQIALGIAIEAQQATENKNQTFHSTESALLAGWKMMATALKEGRKVEIID